MDCPPPSPEPPHPPDTASPRGAGSAVDRWIQRFGAAAHLLLVLAIYAVIVLMIGLALAPALWLLAHWLPWALQAGDILRWPLAGIGFGLAFFAAGFTLLLVVPLANALLPTRVRPYRGAYYALAAVPWMLHNALF